MLSFSAPRGRILWGVSAGWCFFNESTHKLCRSRHTADCDTNSYIFRFLSICLVLSIYLLDAHGTEDGSFEWISLSRRENQLGNLVLLWPRQQKGVNATVISCGIFPALGFASSLLGGFFKIEMLPIMLTSLVKVQNWKVGTTPIEEIELVDFPTSQSARFNKKIFWIIYGIYSNSSRIQVLKELLLEVTSDALVKIRLKFKLKIRKKKDQKAMIGERAARRGRAVK